MGTVFGRLFRVRGVDDSRGPDGRGAQQRRRPPKGRTPPRLSDHSLRRTTQRPRPPLRQPRAQQKAPRGRAGARDRPAARRPRDAAQPAGRGSPGARRGRRRAERADRRREALSAQAAQAPPERAHRASRPQPDRVHAGRLGGPQPGLAESAQPLGRAAQSERDLHPPRAAARRARALVGGRARRVRRQHRQRHEGAHHRRRGLAQVPGRARDAAAPAHGDDRPLQDPVRVRGRPERSRASVPRALDRGARSLPRRVRRRASACKGAGASPATSSRSWTASRSARRRAFRCAIRTSRRTSSAASGSTRRSRSTVWVAGGFSGLSGTGFHPGTPATKATLQFTDRDGNGVLSGLNEIQVIPGSAATPSQNFSRFGYGADLRLGVNEPSLGATVLWSELYWAKNLDRGVLPADPVAFGRDYREFGLYVGADAGARTALAGRRPLRLLQPRRRLGEHGDGGDQADRPRLPDLRLRGGPARAVGPSHRRVRHQPQPQRARHAGEPGQSRRRTTSSSAGRSAFEAPAGHPARRRRRWSPAAAPAPARSRASRRSCASRARSSSRERWRPTRRRPGPARHQRRRHQQHHRLPRRAELSRSPGR